VEPEKQPLLANGSETTFLCRQRLDKHFPAAADTHVAVEVLLETVFCTRSVQSGYKDDSWGNRVSSVRESVKVHKTFMLNAVYSELANVAITLWSCILEVLISNLGLDGPRHSSGG
jgi:hypothetical protein